jgi:hypothetical protein
MVMNLGTCELDLEAGVMRTVSHSLKHSEGMKPLMLRSIRTALIVISIFLSLAQAQSKSLTSEVRPHMSVEKGKLVARNIVGGKVLWTFGQHLLSNVVAHEDLVFPFSKSQVLYAVSVSNGKPKWSIQLKNLNFLGDNRSNIFMSLYFHENYLILSYNTVDVIDSEKGRKLFSVRDGGNSSYYGAYKNFLMIGSVSSGAIMTFDFSVYDLKNRNLIWQRTNMPIIQFEGTLFFPSNDPINHLDDPWTEEVNVTDIQTGYTHLVYRKVAEAGTKETKRGFLLRNGCGRALPKIDQGLKSAYTANANYFYVKRKDECGFFFWRFSWTKNPTPEPTIIPISK